MKTPRFPWEISPAEAMQRFNNALQHTTTQHQLSVQQQALYEQELHLQHQQYYLKQQQIYTAARAQGLMLGQTIRQRREERGIDTNTLEQFCNIPPGTLSYLESGNDGAVPLAYVLSVLHALGLDIQLGAKG